jgi:hypothetical protein
MEVRETMKRAEFVRADKTLRLNITIAFILPADLSAGRMKAIVAARREKPAQAHARRRAKARAEEKELARSQSAE